MGEQARRIPRRVVLGAGLAAIPWALIGSQRGELQARAQPDIRQTTVIYRQASGVSLTVDLFLPDGARATAGRAAVLFFHGANQQPAQFFPQARAFAERGYIAGSANYRVVDQQHPPLAPFPAGIVDAKAAIRWIRAKADTYNVDPGRVAVAGGSQGGHLAAMAALTPGMWEEGEHLDQGSTVQAALLLNPVLDWGDPELGVVPSGIERYLGGTRDDVPENYVAQAAARYVSATTPPTLLLHGTADMMVPYGQSVALRDAIQAVGGVAELFTAEGAGHGFFNAPPWNARTLDAMVRFASPYLDNG